MRIKFFVLLIFIAINTFAQFPGIVGSVGTTAMYKDSSAFVAWGKMCNITRGYQDISNTSLGYANAGDSSKAIAKADGSTVSLGDGGSAIVTFSAPIKNGPGFDFAVFENSFNGTFLELGFIEVSSDGLNFFRFPPTSNSQYTLQYGNSASIDATKLNNLGGKYRILYGTPFDLQELTGIPQLNVSAITHVKIIDVVGSITAPYATYDKNNNPVNDPWPTPYPSSGFDLDAVGVINQAAVGINELEKNDFVRIYPNPVNSKFKIQDLKIEG
ncbi:MAG TPA: T9SS C-terminal target domain-containing protein, partial [Bacteroidia bacterium]|nr:T9SS C-terminal target domain-containing protein [Bacteroidia bacterium]